MMTVFIDSGAFTALNKGKPICVDAYSEWLKANKKYYKHYCNLDVIGDGEASYKNWVRMRKHGLNPIPVYHTNTAVKWLDMYLEEGADYVCIGAVAFKFETNRLRELDHLWATKLIDKNRMPKVKVHGFGLTGFKVMRRYPWYSVDSSSWSYAGRTGFLFIPKRINGVFRLDMDGYHRYVSSRGNRNASSKHMDNCFELERQEVLDWLKQIDVPYGLSTWRDFKEGEELAENESVWDCKHRRQIKMVECIVERGVYNDHTIRDEANIKYFVLTAEAMPKWPWPLEVQTWHEEVLL